MPDEKDLKIMQLEKQVSDLLIIVKEQQETIKELREKLNKNSGNSSKPPSTDGFKKPVKKDRSLREKSGKKPGGQPGHKGSHLDLTVLSKPDHKEELAHNDCKNCPHYNECRKNANANIKETRYVVDAVVKVSVTEYDILSVPECPFCGEEKTGAFPDSVKSYIQYGKNLEALAVSLNTVGTVSVNRTHEILSGVFNIPISTGTIAAMVSRTAGKVTSAYDMIGEKLKKSPLNHADETGLNIDGKLEWGHCVSNSKYTYLALNTKRGFQAVKDMGILTDFQGILVHDCWSSYWKLDGVTHQLCCAHLLRELGGVSENNPEQKWVSRFKELLIKMKSSKERAINQGKDALCKTTLNRYSKLYDEIIDLAYEENPLPEKTPGKRGKQKRGKILCLIDRLKEHKGEVCLFINNLSVPFDNNQAERDLRNIKVKTKVSGFFKTEKGAADYLKIMSFVGTAKKLGKTAYDAIRLAVSGAPDLIFE